MDQEVLYEVRDRVAIITMNRPARLNAYTPALGNALKGAVAEANEDRAARVIVLTGAGRGFCAGADMDVLSGHIAGASSAASPRESSSDERFRTSLGPDLASDFRDADRFGYFVRAKKPVIAAINGPAAGMGLVMSLYADLRFAAQSAVLTTSFAQRGLIAEHGISWLLPKLVGQANALDLLLSARRIGANEAKAMGLLNDVYPDTTFLQDVLGYARNLVQTVSPRSMAVMKAQVWKVNFQNFNDALALADEEMRASLSTDEFKEGVEHFLERRAPNFADI